MSVVYFKFDNNDCVSLYVPSDMRRLLAIGHCKSKVLDILQGSVVTCLQCDAIFNDDLLQMYCWVYSESLSHAVFVIHLNIIPPFLDCPTQKMHLHVNVW